MIKRNGRVHESKSRVKVLYVCPTAHWGGHYPEAVIKESLALSKAGADVFICSFSNVIGQKSAKIKPYRTVLSSWFGYPLGILTPLEKFSTITRGFSWFCEQLSTLLLAIKLRGSLRYDVIYLRDGDPFLFMPFFLGLFSRNLKWAIRIIGLRQLRSPGTVQYRFINAPFWKPLYRLSMLRNRFILLCENEYIKNHVETSILDGIFSGMVRVVRPGINRDTNPVDKAEARRYLGLPQEKAIFLNFGALHPGKDIEPVLSAIRDLPEVLLVHAGVVLPGINLKQLVKGYGVSSQLIIRDYYIPAEDEPYYFASADAIILSYKKDFMQTASMLQEAAKFGLPAIAADVGELGELVKSYGVGLVFEAGNGSALRDALQSFLKTSRGERLKMVSHCDELCKDFSMERWGQLCLDTFFGICGVEYQESQR
ncbi:glycosyltransferase family 4 protein [Chloroflexota bacterium]